MKRKSLRRHSQPGPSGEHGDDVSFRPDSASTIIDLAEQHIDRRTPRMSPSHLRAGSVTLLAVLMASGRGTPAHAQAQKEDAKPAAKAKAGKNKMTLEEKRLATIYQGLFRCTYYLKQT